jgi:transcriptional regulator with GAF, ATPase, and Fis domain
LNEAADVAPVMLLGYIERTNQTMDTSVLSITSLRDDFLQRTQPASVVGLPIILQGKTRGVLYFDSRIPNTFSATDLGIISSLATQVGRIVMAYASSTHICFHQAVLALEKTSYAKQLESKVIERTAELMTRNAELEVAKRSAEDAKEAETRYVSYHFEAIF